MTDGGGMNIPDLATIIQYTHFTRVTRSEQVACYTLMVYDWLLCWEHELDLLSTRGIPPAKVAYIFCRYWPLLTYPLTIWAQVTETRPSVCEKIFQLPLFLAIINFAAAASILIVRIYAFTGSRLTIAAGLIAACLAAGIFQIWAVATQIELVAGPPACFPEDKRPANKALSWYFFAPFLFDLVATSVFVFCAARIRFATAGSSTAVSVFIREGIVYFLAISAINLGNAAMSFQPQVAISGTLAAFSMSMPNILACRLVINLRSTVSKPLKGGTNMSTDVDFTAPPRTRRPYRDEFSMETMPLTPTQRQHGRAGHKLEDSLA